MKTKRILVGSTIQVFWSIRKSFVVQSGHCMYPCAYRNYISVLGTHLWAWRV